MTAFWLLLAAQAAPDIAPAQPPQRRLCVRQSGEIVPCRPKAQQAPYRLPKVAPQAYGPALPSAQADLGKGVRATLRGQASNSARARRNKPVATLSVPF